MANNFHKIKAKLHPNLLTEDPNDFLARVISERTLNTRCHTACSVFHGNSILRRVVLVDFGHSVDLIY